ncbi:MAG: hypothetical protein AB7F79_02655 [Steroidobacteraceae bacterium]
MRSAAATHTTSVESPLFKKTSSLPLTGTQEEALLKLDLSDLVLPNVNDLQVDGLKSSWLSRLMGR